MKWLVESQRGFWPDQSTLCVFRSFRDKERKWGPENREWGQRAPFDPAGASN